MSESATHVAIETVARDSYGRLVVYIAARTGDIADAQDALSKALVATLETWPAKGVPDKPEAWLLHVAHNRAIDASRRARTRRDAEPLLQQLAEETETTTDIETNGTFADDTLRMMFVCFHPQLSAEAQTALALRTLCGLSAAEIAACHSTATDEASTNWPRILSLYDQLLKLNGSPIVALNRAVAVARVHGSQAGLDALDNITPKSSLESYHLFHAVRSTIAAELGRRAAAIAHFQRAGALAALPSEREFIARRIRECEASKSQ